MSAPNIVKSSGPPRAGLQLRALLAAAACAAPFAIAEIAGAAEPQPATARKLLEGPPTIAPKDFRGVPPVEDPTQTDFRALANTHVKLDYRYTFRGAALSPKKYQAEVDTFDVEARFDPEGSWWRPDTPQTLLDHEQGHVDLGWIAALEMRRDVRQEVRRGRLKVAAANQAEAEKALKKKIVDLTAPYFDRHQSYHQEYDKETGNGTLGDKQALARRAQAKRLNELLQEAKSGK